MKKTQIEPYLSRHLHSVGIQKGLPIGGNFELTARCNFNCPMCYVHLSQNDVNALGRELSAQEWIDIAKQARDRGMVFALLTGGEPFIRSDFFEIYHAMKAMGLLISINTNGSLLKGKIREKLIEDPPFRINVSLYGGSRETYIKMCGQDIFDTVLDNISAVKKAGIDVRLNLSITPYNKDDIDKIYSIAEKLNVHVKATSYMYPPVRVNGENYGCGDRLTAQEAAWCQVHWDELRFTDDEFAVRAENMKNLAAVDENECSVEIDRGVRCRAGRSCFWMTWDGKMMPCGMMPFPVAYPMEVGFDDAWNTIKQKTDAIQMPQECSVCKNRELCTVCAAVCITETGKFDKVPEYVCRQTEEKIKATWQSYCNKKMESI